MGALVWSFVLIHKPTYISQAHGRSMALHGTLATDTTRRVVSMLGTPRVKAALHWSDTYMFVDLLFTLPFLFPPR